jgi:hypothetical protein
MAVVFSKMPKIDLDKIDLTAEERELASSILVKARPNTGKLYVSMSSDAPGEARYLWRMVVFYISPLSRHHQMPVMAFTYLPGETRAERQSVADRLDEIVDKIVDSVGVSQWTGVMAWKSLS